jgi:hypothetical protein
VRIPDGVINPDRLLYFRRKAAAKTAPKATMETRVALIVAERGLTKKQMAKYFVRRRKNKSRVSTVGVLQKTKTFRPTGCSTAI